MASSTTPTPEAVTDPGRAAMDVVLSIMAGAIDRWDSTAPRQRRAVMSAAADFVTEVRAAELVNA